MNYNTGKIYILKNYINDYFYIGSTCSQLAKRLYEHKCDLRKVCKSNTYKKMQEIGIEPCDLYIELLEACRCDNVYQLRKREGQVILKMLNSEYSKFCLNRRISGRTKHDYRIDNHEKIKDYNTKYYIDNLDVIKGKQKEYRIVNHEKIYQKVGCIVCKRMVCLHNFKQHCKTKKHQKNLSTN